MNKTKYFLIGFILVSSFTFATMVRAQDYEIGINDDAEFVWRVSIVNEDALEELFGSDWDEDCDSCEVGAQWKMAVTDLSEDNDVIEVEYDSWDYTTGEFDENPDNENRVTYVYLDPEDAVSLLGIIFASQYIVAIPTNEYLDAVVDAINDDDVSIEGSTVTIENRETSEGEEYDQKYTYNNQGVLSSMQYVYEGNTVYELSLSGFIPGYEFPILLGITGIFSIGLIYTMMRRKK